MTKPKAIPLRCPKCRYDISQSLRDGIKTCPECGCSTRHDDRRDGAGRFPITTSPWAIAAWLLVPSAIYAVSLTLPAFGDGAVLRDSTPRAAQAVEFTVLGALCLGTPILIASHILWSINLYYAMLGDRVEVNGWRFIPAFVGGLLLSICLILFMFNIW